MTVGRLWGQSPTINGLMAALVAELIEAEGGPGFDPFAERLTLLAVWADLCSLAGETPPAPDQPVEAAVHRIERAWRWCKRNPRTAAKTISRALILRRHKR